MKTNPRRKKPLSRAKARPAAAVPSAYTRGIVIEGVRPAIEEGHFAVKTVRGRPFTVEADVYKDGHEVLACEVKVAEKGSPDWRAWPMAPIGNDRWRGTFVPEKNTRYLYTVEAWVDVLATWLKHIEKKAHANMDVASDVSEGCELLGRLKAADKWIRQLKADPRPIQVMSVLKNPEFLTLLKSRPLKAMVTRHEPALEVISDRPRAETGAWYEMFPRSQSPDPSRSGTFKDCIRRLDDIKQMGFDVIYLPPIHPIGRTNRKGPNNTLRADGRSPGSPWAIGVAEGGHKAVHPDLGTLADFRAFVAAAADAGIEIALDFAAQCAPDHPYVKDHPEWFYRLPDGTIRFAENPPKKYEDIYPLNFHCADRDGLWREMKSIFDHWIAQGVKIFRVDNPHTKPFRFWQWLIGEIQKDHPEVLFLAEAFTRPKVMKFLAKAGFSQSYTYFTWRNAKWELKEYFTELIHTDMRHYFRPNLFANTPDILHETLQKGGPAAFRLRLVLAATLSPTYGIYSGYELCENTPLHEGSEEYLNSEKYEQKTRDWDAPGNIKDLIARVNLIRSEHEALRQYTNFRFFENRNDNILAYGKWSDDLSDVIVTVVNLDPFRTHEDLLTFPAERFGIQDWQAYQMKDLLTGDKYDWKGREHYVRLDPAQAQAHIFHLRA